MFSLTSLFALLAPLPAFEKNDGNPGARRRRAIQQLRLSRHMLHDVGMENFENPADDPRWIHRHDLER